ncbi:hypothetical protein ACGF0J_33935 [Nonomuraea sp. NPDC047897]|uniref:hypothetical protein n=1 Tax=Nonomuraea sp. NPDC047897 TaxID=3364346 RepID=UPI00371FC115
MTEPTLHARGAGFDDSRVRLEETATVLQGLQRRGDGSSGDVHAAAELSLGALGLVGEAARLRYNKGFADFRERLARGGLSATQLPERITTSKEGYAQAEHSGVRAMLALKDATGSLDYQLLQDGGTYSSVNPLFGPPNRDKLWQLAAMDGAAAGGALAGLKLRNMLANKQYVALGSDYEDRYHHNQQVEKAHRSGDRDRMQKAAAAKQKSDLSRAARQSSRTAALLKAAAGLSFAAVMGSLLWSTAIVRSDDELDAHVDYWADIARELDAQFGGGDPAGRRALAEAWSGGAMEAADAKLRAFMTAGIQLSDRAVAHAYDLAQAVETLNAVHDMAVMLTAAEVGTLLMVRMMYSINPVAALTLQEAVGRKLTITVMALHSALFGVMGTVLYAGMDAQAHSSGPDGVPAQDFPVWEA